MKWYVVKSKIVISGTDRAEIKEGITDQCDIYEITMYDTKEDAYRVLNSHMTIIRELQVGKSIRFYIDEARIICTSEFNTENDAIEKLYQIPAEAFSKICIRVIDNQTYECYATCRSYEEAALISNEHTMMCF